MKQIRVRFEPDSSLDHIEVVVRAAQEDEAVLALMNDLWSSEQKYLSVSDDSGKICRIPESGIISVSVTGKTVSVLTEKGSYRTKQSLQYLEEHLNPQDFIRISRHELVNLRMVRRFDFTLTGTLRLELAGGFETWASRRCIPAIRKRLSGGNKTC